MRLEGRKKLPRTINIGLTLPHFCLEQKKTKTQNIFETAKKWRCKNNSWNYNVSKRMNPQKWHCKKSRETTTHISKIVETSEPPEMTRQNLVKLQCFKIVERKGEPSKLWNWHCKNSWNCDALKLSKRMNVNDQNDIAKIRETEKSVWFDKIKWKCEERTGN